MTPFASLLNPPTVSQSFSTAIALTFLTAAVLIDHVLLACNFPSDVLESVCATSEPSSEHVNTVVAFKKALHNSLSDIVDEHKKTRFLHCYDWTICN